MIPTGFAILAAALLCILTFQIGRLVEFNRSRWEIDVLTKVIEGYSKEEVKEE